MPAPPERFRFPSAAWLAALLLLTPGCSVWQLGDIAPDYVDASSHRGVEVLAFDAEAALAAGDSEAAAPALALLRTTGLEDDALRRLASQIGGV